MTEASPSLPWQGLLWKLHGAWWNDPNNVQLLTDFTTTLFKRLAHPRHRLNHRDSEEATAATTRSPVRS